MPITKPRTTLIIRMPLAYPYVNALKPRDRDRFIALFSCMGVFHSIFSIRHMPHYLTFMGRNLENRKKLTLVRITSSVGMINKNSVNSVSIFIESVTMNNISNK